jgi:hypothetical protein
LRHGPRHGLRQSARLLLRTGQFVLESALSNRNDAGRAGAGRLRAAAFLWDRPDRHLVLYGSDEEVGTVEFDVAGLQARIAEAEPAYLAFNGKNAARGALERAVELGPQEEQIGGAGVWVLPSTSGAARRYWDLGPWRELADACASA